MQYIASADCSDDAALYLQEITSINTRPDRTCFSHYFRAVDGQGGFIGIAFHVATLICQQGCGKGLSAAGPNISSQWMLPHLGCESAPIFVAVVILTACEWAAAAAGTCTLLSPLGAPRCLTEGGRRVKVGILVGHHRKCQEARDRVRQIHEPGNGTVG